MIIRTSNRLLLPSEITTSKLTTSYLHDSKTAIGGSSDLIKCRIVSFHFSSTQYYAFTSRSGKRNTSLAFFTSHERSLLKSTWGSQATRLSRDSFLPFASCQLCLQIARGPVACASGGDIFCRECVVSNLLAQRKEIKRLEKEDARRRTEGEEESRARGEEEKGRAVEQFERVMMGMEGGMRKGPNENQAGKEDGTAKKEGKGVKRKFELDEDEMLKNAMEERAKARKALEEEKVWLLGSTNSTFGPRSLHS